VKLYTAEWRGDSGLTSSPTLGRRYLEKCVELGVRKHPRPQGPTIWPLNRDSFDVADIDDAATEFRASTSISRALRAAPLEDFCWIGVQEPNVYGGLAVAMPFIFTGRGTSPR